MDEEEVEVEDTGIFDDDDDAFWASEDHEHTVIEETEEPQSQNGNTVIESKMNGNKKLVCLITPNGPQVARATIDSSGEVSLDEPYRNPTQAELVDLNKNGQIVKLGPQNNHQMGSTPPMAQDSTGGGKMKTVAFGAGLLALAGGGLYLYKKYKSDDDDEDGDEE